MNENEPTSGAEVKRNAPYAWIIDVDKIYDPDDAEPAAVGTSGPRSGNPENFKLLARGEGIKFRLKDDDGGIYYEGRFVGDSEGEDAFGPLDDFGMPNAGCTSIEYLRDGGGWEVL